tara:strand:- start:656 stop:991 length:336 start_codon:yes stop_codon:yes gene_type:complete
MSKKTKTTSPSGVVTKTRVKRSGKVITKTKGKENKVGENDSPNARKKVKTKTKNGITTQKVKIKTESGKKYKVKTTSAMGSELTSKMKIREKGSLTSRKTKYSKGGLVQHN